MTVVEAAIAYVLQLFRNNSGGHDAAHTLRVYRNALQIAEQETDCDLEIVSLAALLHDTDDHKLFDTKDNANARSFLTDHGIAPERIERIIAAINAVSFSRNRGKRPETFEGKIVQDADRLDAIGAVGIARTFAYCGEYGRNLDASIRHFYDKLLLLKAEMNTQIGREMAQARHQYMVGFLAEYEQETTDQTLCKERADGATPNGGSYSEIYYQDDNGNAADKEVATRCEIVEFDAEGRFISSTLGFIEKKKLDSSSFFQSGA